VSCNRTHALSLLYGAILVVSLQLLPSGCKPGESPELSQEIKSLRKLTAKQESVIVSLQEGNKVMQQQINLLNGELRDAKKETDRAEAERKALAAKLEAQTTANKRLTSESQRLAAKKAQAVPIMRIEDKSGQSEDLPHSLAAVSQAVERALSRNGYTVKVSVKAEEKAVYITERKVSAPASLEVPGFRNQYLVSLQTLPANGTKLSVKADFEKMLQGGRILTAGAEETAEIEKRLITEISKTVAPPGKI
jgi:hypothetical protein